MTRLILKAAFFSIVLCSCDAPLDISNISGDYIFETNGVRQVVKVDQDGQYLSTVHKNEKVVWEDRGQWKLEQIGSKSGIVFSKFRFGIDGYSHVPGYWFVEPESNFLGTVVLCFDLDLNLCFEKTGEEDSE